MSITEATVTIVTVALVVIGVVALYHLYYKAKIETASLGKSNLSLLAPESKEEHTRTPNNQHHLGVETFSHIHINEDGKVTKINRGREWSGEKEKKVTFTVLREESKLVEEALRKKAEGDVKVTDDTTVAILLRDEEEQVEKFLEKIRKPKDERTREDDKENLIEALEEGLEHLESELLSAASKGDSKEIQRTFEDLDWTENLLDDLLDRRGRR